MADLVLPRGELKVLKAEDKDYERGMLVKLLDDGGYKMAYWYDKPNKPYPVEIIVDGESIKKDGKIVEMKFHPKDYYDKVKEESVMTSLNEDKLQKKAFDIIKDLNQKYPTYNVKFLGAFNKVVKNLKAMLPGVSNLNLGKIALDYHSYRKGDMGRKIPTIKKMAHTMRKVGVKEMKESTKLEELVGKPITEAQFDEAAGKKDACYHKVKARYDVWPSAYASGALVKCRKVGAKNWGNKSKKEGVNEVSVGVNVHYFYKKANKNKNKFFKMLSDFRKKHSDTVWIKMLNYALEDFNENPKKYKTIDDKQNILFKNLQNNKKVKEGLGDRMSKKLKKLKGVNLKKKKIRLKAKSGRGKISHLGMEGFASNAQRRAAFASGYKAKGKKKKNEDVFFESTTENGMTTNHIYYEEDGKGYGYTLEFVNDLNEAEYQGRKVKLGKIMQGDAKKFKVYVKNPKGNVVKVNFGQGGKAKGGTMKIRKSNPKARANFRARHNCDNPGPRHKARYWSCRKW